MSYKASHHPPEGKQTAFLDVSCQYQEALLNPFSEASLKRTHQYNSVSQI